MSTAKEITEDFLNVDKPLPGQNYVCMSFVSPEKVLETKRDFFMHKFIMEKLEIEEGEKAIKEITEEYEAFLVKNSTVLEKSFYEKNDFHTSVRGIKVRGTFDSMREAQVRATVLQRLDPSHNVFVGQVGYWLPWDPNPENITDQEYGETELNTLVKKYKENEMKKNIHFEQEKRERMQKAMEEGKKPDKFEDTLFKTEESSTLEEEYKNMENKDPWLEKQTTSVLDEAIDSLENTTVKEI
tara:strand:- start:446 stop:1168 length:723 start_codon:yes stop_codon:yes gene_type:complete